MTKQSLESFIKLGEKTPAITEDYRPVYHLSNSMVYVIPYSFLRNIYTWAELCESGRDLLFVELYVICPLWKSLN